MGRQEPLNLSVSSIHLLDAQIDGKSGGTSKAFDWELIKDERNIILAGGFNVKNIAKAIELKCSAYDINSGVESESGQKDQKKSNKLLHTIATIFSYCYSK